MNNSTDGVTLYAAFIQDVLKNYESSTDDYNELLNFTKGYDILNPLIKFQFRFTTICVAGLKKI